jgi:hypothetical protein
MGYGKSPKNIRFSEYILEESSKYQRLKGLSFSELVRLSLQDYLRRKMYGTE